MGHTSSRVASKSTTRKSRKQLETENYRRQKQSLYVKLERMHRCFGVNMQMVLKRNGKVEIFTSEGQIVSALGLHEAQVCHQLFYYTIRYFANLPHRRRSILHLRLLRPVACDCENVRQSRPVRQATAKSCEEELWREFRATHSL